VEEDTIFTTQEIIKQTPVPSWGLSRISSRNNTSPTTYSYDSSAGSGVTVYVIDTGVQTTHDEFEGRAIPGANFVDENNTDNLGHGTHVAGTIAGKTCGVAKKASIVAVKVLGDSGAGRLSDILAGLEWVVNDASTRSGPSLSVANMSLGGRFSQALNSAVQAAINSGIFCVVAVYSPRLLCWLIILIVKI
jgi:oryzin